MTNIEFQKAFAEALKKRYDTIDNPEGLSYENEFSPRFEYRMKRMIKNFEYIRRKTQTEAEKSELIVMGRYAVRRAVAIVLAAVLIMALAACAVHYVLTWNEKNNDEQGTLDVNFEMQNPDYAKDNFAFKEPTVPDSYVRRVVYQENKIQDIEYKEAQSEKMFYYNQSVVTETMNLSLDNEAESFAEIEINGHRGYSVDEPEYSAITWSDGVSLYTISGNISLQELIPIAESIE